MTDSLQSSKNTKSFKIIGWVRDKKGVVIKRPLKDICNTITTFVSKNGYGGGSLSNTTPYVLEIQEIEL